MPNTDIYGLMSVKGGQKQKIMNFSNAREKTYAQYQQLTDAQKKGVIVVDDYPIPEESDSVSVTADGVKTYGQLLEDLWGLLDTSKFTTNSYLLLEDVDGINRFNSLYTLRNFNASRIMFTRDNADSSSPFLSEDLIYISSNYTVFRTATASNYSDSKTNDVPTSGTKITLVYDYYKNLDIHTEYLAKNCMLTGGGNVEDELDSTRIKSKRYTFSTFTENTMVLDLNINNAIVYSIRVIDRQGWSLIARCGVSSVTYPDNWVVTTASGATLTGTFVIDVFYQDI